MCARLYTCLEEKMLNKRKEVFLDKGSAINKVLLKLIAFLSELFHFFLIIFTNMFISSESKGDTNILFKMGTAELKLAISSIFWSSEVSGNMFQSTSAIMAMKENTFSKGLENILSYIHCCFHCNHDLNYTLSFFFLLGSCHVFAIVMF